MNIRYAFIPFIFVSFLLKAEIKLPSIFSSHMVLQQETKVKFWGTSAEMREVTLAPSWNNEIYRTKSDKEGNWEFVLSTPSAGGPYDIVISDGAALTLGNVLIGEVWICSGQSNMAMPMRGLLNQPVKGSNEAVARSENPNIRLFTVGRNSDLKPLDDFKGKWKHCLPGNVADFSAVGYFFGDLLNETLDVPVGLICTSWGGSKIEAWMSADVLRNYNWVEIPKKLEEKKRPNRTPTLLYNAMIHPMIGYGIRGIIWYQGESNKNKPEQYEELMQGLVESWRSDWGMGDFPFYYVQIAPFGYNGLNSAFFREAQLKAADKIPNSGLVSLLDIGDEKGIHPAQKKEVGERLGFIALSKTYGKEGIAWSGPMLKDFRIAGRKVYLTFDHAEKGLTSYGKDLTNFTIAGNDRKFYPAQAKITKEGITLESDEVDNPVAVRYGFQDFVIGDLFNTAGLPASSFRTDDWNE
ncbi:MAG: sialate O-acetylesterase [Phycisphaeraceae bacterium]|nr:sialate O-acetylesterase [Phycisphaeraceae bacterium]